ncbi:MAG: hypothetical protein WCJ45_05575 [bacterium]
MIFDEKAFGIDMSHNNQEIDIKDLVNWNEKKLMDGKEDTKPVKFIYLRTSYGCKDPNHPIDANLRHNLEEINKHNKTCEEDEKILVGFYFFYVPDQDPQEQAEHFIETVKDL